MSEMQYPVASVLPLVGVTHLDRAFDYAVPTELDAQVQPGTRVRIRFGGRLVDGFVLDRRRHSDHPGTLRPLERLISPLVVLSPQMRRLVEELAQRSAGTRADILRTAIPARHARAEKQGLFQGGKPWVDLFQPLTPRDEVRADALGRARRILDNYVGGEEFLARVFAGTGGSADSPGVPNAGAGEGNEVQCAGAPRGTGSNGGVIASLLNRPGDIPADVAAAVAAAVVWAQPGINPLEATESAAGNGNDGQRSVLIVAPNVKTVQRVTQSLQQWMSPAQITVLHAQESPDTRYRRFVSIARGQARVVVGTRSAAFAPLHNLTLMILLGEGDDSLVDLRSPYLHARQVLYTRARLSGAHLLLLDPHRSAEVQQWIDTDAEAKGASTSRITAMSLPPKAVALRERMPWVRGVGDTDSQREREAHSPGSRIPHVAFEAIRHSLDRHKPVLIQVPRQGYAPAVACAKCRTPARCRVCNGPLELSAAASTSAAAPTTEPRSTSQSTSQGTSQSISPSQPVPTCRWCAALHANYNCPNCGNHTLRMSAVGHLRTAEEVGRAFPGTRIIQSGGTQVKNHIPPGPQIIVATPGAEPIPARGGYGAAIILDPWISLTRQDLRATENALRQWMWAALLVEPASVDGTVIVAAESGLPTIQYLIRWAGEAAARAELASRSEANFPPATVVAAVDGTAETIDELLQNWEKPPATELLGPVPLPSGIRLPAGLDASRAAEAQRLIIRVPHPAGKALGHSLKTAQSVRHSQHHTGPLRVVMDPVRIG